MRIVFFGTPEFAVPSLDAIRKAGFELPAVVTAPDRPAGRGMKPRLSAVKQWAVDQDVPVLQPENLRDPAFLETLKELRADIQVVVAFRFLPEKVWAMPPLGTFNLHASLLPQYRGAAPINHALINGETTTGITTFFLDRQIDTGKLLLQQAIPVDPEDNAGTLYDKLMREGASLVVKTLEMIRDNSLVPQDQSERMPPGVMLHPAPKLNKEMAAIRWDRPAQNIHNLVRGLSPYPAAYSQLWMGETLLFSMKILQSRVTDDRHEAVPGSVETDFKRNFRVKTGDYWVELLQVQPEGRKCVSIGDFLNGFAQQLPDSEQIAAFTMR